MLSGALLKQFRTYLKSQVGHGWSIDDLNDRQEMVYELVEERSAKDLPTTYNDVVPLLKNIEDPNRQARKTLDQLVKKKLLISKTQVRNKKNTNWYWINKLVQEL